MRFEQRVLHQTTDISETVNDYRTGAYTFPYETGDYLYIGSAVPFNNLWFEVGTANYVDVYEVQTLTFPAVVDADPSDYIVIYDQTGTSWAVALDTTGADADPTGAAWLAVSGARRIKVDISGVTTPAQVAALALIGLNSLTGFTARITLANIGSGALTSTQTAYGATINPAPHNADDTGVGNILGVETTPGSVGAVPTLEIWFGNEWVPAVDVADGTNGLSTSGRLQFNTEYTKSWDVELRSYDVTGLETTSIYNMYWFRLSWSNDFKPTTTIKYIGQKFSDDNTLYSFYPDLAQSQILAAFEAGKTDWNEQHYMAAEHIIRDLVKRSIIRSRGQLLDYYLLVDASCHKVAEIVYTAFGIPYFDQLKVARTAYKEAIDLKYFKADQNGDGRLDPFEKKVEAGFGTR